MLKKSPWPHLLLDNFLPEEVLHRSYGELRSDAYDFEIEARGTGRIEYSLLRSEALWRAVYSSRTVTMLTAAFGVQIALNRHNVLQLRRMNDETPDFPIHNDSTPEGESIVSFLYLSPGWTPECGGCLQLFHTENQGAPSESIAPIANRFVAFRTDQDNWHSVARVHHWERLSVLAMWDIQGTAELAEPASIGSSANRVGHRDVS